MADIFASGEWFILLFAMCSLALAGVIALGLPTPRRSGQGRSISDVRPRTQDRGWPWGNTHTREPDRAGCGPRNADNSMKDESPQSVAGLRRIRAGGYMSGLLLVIGAVFVFVKGVPPIRVFLAVSIVGGTAITMLIRYLAGHQPSISLEQSPDMTDA